MTEELAFLISGIVFGLSAGISPGPLMTLVVSETLKHGRSAGFRVALAPLFTDFPILFISIFVLSKISNINLLLGLISLLGAGFIGYLGVESLMNNGLDVNAKKAEPASLKKGIMINLLNPHPYVFFFTVGGPMMVKALEINIVAAALFILSFLACLVGSKFLIAFLINKSKSFLKSSFYINTIKFIGVILFIYAILFLKNGLELLTLI